MRKLFKKYFKKYFGKLPYIKLYFICLFGFSCSCYMIYGGFPQFRELPTIIKPVVSLASIIYVPLMIFSLPVTIFWTLSMFIGLIWNLRTIFKLRNSITLVWWDELLHLHFRGVLIGMGIAFALATLHMLIKN